MSNPTLLVSQFASDLSYTDQSGSGSWFGTDPIRFDGGLWLEEGTTNYVLNPSAEVDATVAGHDGCTVTRVTSEHSVGSAAFEVDYDGAVNYEYVGFSQLFPPVSSAPDPYTLSVDLKGPAAQAVRTRINYFANGFANQRNETKQAVLTGAFARFAHTFAANGGDTVDAFQIGVTNSPNFNVTVGPDITIYADAVQFEQKPYATSYCDSSLGDGYTLNGDNTSSRAASSASVATAGAISSVAGSFNIQELTRLTDTGAEEIYGECGTVGSGTDALRWGVTASGTFFVEWNSDNAGWERTATTDTIDVDTPYWIAFDWDGTAVSIRIDNGPAVTGTRDPVEDDWGVGDLVLEAA